MAEIKNFPNNVDEYIGAEDVMKWLHGRTSGVFGADGNLAVTVSDGMTVNVSDGVGWLSNSDGDGTVFWNDTKEQSGSPLALTLSIASATMPRIDRIVVSWETVDYAARPTIEVLTGTPAVSPQAPAITNNQLKRQISLAQIYVDTAASKLTADNITDERLDGTVCGLVTDWITVDTTTMQGQFSAFLAQIQTELAQLHAGTASMTKAEYDPDGSVSNDGGISAAIEKSQKKLDPEGAVSEAGGIPEYVENHNQDWSKIENKPALMISDDFSSETLEALLAKIQGKSPRMGSANITKDSRVANTWWNFMYIPHRTGSGGDNPDHGTLLIFPMVSDGYAYIIRAAANATVAGIQRIRASSDDCSFTLRNADWSASAPYTQTKSLSWANENMMATRPIAYLDSSALGNAAGVNEAARQIGLIKMIYVSNGSVTFMCPDEKPTWDLIIRTTLLF